jgi:putative ABC transport system substrate-binding protein
VTNGTPATAALQQETRTIPIVAGVAEPVASGIVARLDRPSGNITGFALYETTLAGKWLELLSEGMTGPPRSPTPRSFKVARSPTREWTRARA